MIYPVILTGGTGSRLWPVSRKAFPKQFQSFDGGPTLLQSTALRVKGYSFAAPIILTGEDFRFMAADQLIDKGIIPHLTLVEPAGRNTAPAVLAASMAVAEQNAQGLVLVIPADHHIADDAAFRTMIESAVFAANAGSIVTFGITPTRPETGYGYIELEDATGTNGPATVARFVEKPDTETAETFVNSGRHMWNAGIFLFRADVMLDAFNQHAADMVPAVQAAFDQAQSDLNFMRLAEGPWAQVEDISIDYAIMERADNLLVSRFDGSWSDMGAWDAIWREADKSENEVAILGNGNAFDSENSLIYSGAEGPKVVGIGLKDTIVVATKDAVLVADKSKAQEVKVAVASMEQSGDACATDSPRCYRPWGWYETLALGGRFQVKRIVVKPGGVLSLQSHHHRSEHWVVVEGTAKVTLGEEQKLVTENQSVYIPLGTVHRMENPGKFPMVLIEIQTGAYLGEDDILRFEDIYDRADDAKAPSNETADRKAA